MKNRYEIKNNLVYIELYHKKYGRVYTIINKNNFDIVNSINTTWFLGINKTGHIDGVKTKIQINHKRKNIWLHRLITNCEENLVVDHINGNTLDNRRNNLRCVTSKENSSNLRSNSNNKTGYTNIYFENNRYRVRINNNSFGSYKTLNDAIKVRDKNMKNIYPLRKKH